MQVRLVHQSIPTKLLGIVAAKPFNRLDIILNQPTTSKNGENQNYLK